VEFAEHKEYAPGDEIRHIDWKAYGKFDKYYVKRYEHETNLRAFLAVDASASMNYRSGDLSKLEVASMLAASLAYLLIRQQDAVGLLILKESGVRYVPPRSSASHLQAILEELEGLKGEGQTHLAAAADLLSEKARRRSAVMLFSDLFDEDPAALPRLLQLRLRKNDVSIFHVLDPAELEFPFEDNTLFLSMEDARQQQANPREIKESYLEEMGAFVGERARLRSPTSEQALAPAGSRGRGPGRAQDARARPPPCPASAALAPRLLDRPGRSPGSPSLPIARGPQDRRPSARWPRSCPEICAPGELRLEQLGAGAVDQGRGEDDRFTVELHLAPIGSAMDGAHVVGKV
jgi:uncharacterized protein (DUF58 family)